MRAVDYVTHGFGGTWQDVMSAARQALPTVSGSLGALLPPTPEAIISLAFQDAPDSAKSAAIQTYRRFGASGFVRTANFVRALESSEDAFLTMFPGTLSRQISGARLKQIFNALLNTAGARTGLTPLSSLIIQGYRELLSEIPDNYPNALGWWQTRIKNAVPRWMDDIPRLDNLSQRLP